MPLYPNRVTAIIARGSRRLPRDGYPLTPSGLEGSSGSGDAGCRGNAGAGHSYFWRKVDFAAQISGLVPVVALVTLAGRTNAFMQGTTLLYS